MSAAFILVTLWVFLSAIGAHYACLCFPHKKGLAGKAVLASVLLTPLVTMAIAAICYAYTHVTPEKLRAALLFVAGKFWAGASVCFHRLSKYTSKVPLWVFPVLAFFIYIGYEASADKKEREQYFAKHRQEIIAQTRKHIETKNYAKAVGASDPYRFINDKELNALNDKAFAESIRPRETMLLKELDAIPAIESKRRAEKYRELAELNPRNAGYLSSAKSLEDSRDSKPSKTASRDTPLALCKEAVRAYSKYPSKADFTGWPDISSTAVSGTVELMNGFGAMIPHHYYCRFAAGKLKDFQVTPEG